MEGETPKSLCRFGRARHARSRFIPGVRFSIFALSDGPYGHKEGVPTAISLRGLPKGLSTTAKAHLHASSVQSCHSILSRLPFCLSGADRGGWSFHAHDDASRGPKNPEIPIRSLFLSPVVRLEFLCRLSAYWWGDADLHLGADSRKAPLVCTAHPALPAPRSIRSSDQ